MSKNEKVDSKGNSLYRSQEPKTIKVKTVVTAVTWLASLVIVLFVGWFGHIIYQDNVTAQAQQLADKFSKAERR